MDLRKLEIFVAVAEHLSFSAAAEKLHMAQPAVSIAVKKLEDELNVTLLSRDRRHIHLTDEGRHTQQRAQAILAQVDDLQHSVGMWGSLLKGQVKISCPSMVATYTLPDLLADFLAAYPGLKASVTQQGTQHIAQRLLDDDIELGIITLADSVLVSGAESFEYHCLIEQEIQLCVADSHPLSQHSHIGFEALDQLPMALYESDYFIRRAFDNACLSAGVKPDIRLQTNFLPLLKRMVKRGLGATVCLSMMAEQEQDLTGISLYPPLQMSMAIAKRRGRTISRANQAFFDWLKKSR